MDNMVRIISEGKVGDSCGECGQNLVEVKYEYMFEEQSVLYCDECEDSEEFYKRYFNTLEFI